MAKLPGKAAVFIAVCSTISSWLLQRLGVVCDAGMEKAM